MLFTVIIVRPNGGWGEPNFSPACEAASDAHGAVMDFASEGCAMPVPTTLAGLGVLALSVALAEEQALSSTGCDATDRRYIGLVQAVLAVAGVRMPPDYRGLVYIVGEDPACA